MYWLWFRSMQATHGQKALQEQGRGWLGKAEWFKWWFQGWAMPYPLPIQCFWMHFVSSSSHACPVQERPYQILSDAHSVQFELCVFCSRKRPYQVLLDERSVKVESCVFTWEQTISAGFGVYTMLRMCHASLFQSPFSKFVVLGLRDFIQCNIGTSVVHCLRDCLLCKDESTLGGCFTICSTGIMRSNDETTSWITALSVATCFINWEQKSNLLFRMRTRMHTHFLSIFTQLRCLYVCKLFYYFDMSSTVIQCTHVCLYTCTLTSSEMSSDLNMLSRVHAHLWSFSRSHAPCAEPWLLSLLLCVRERICDRIHEALWGRGGLWQRGWQCEQHKEPKRKLFVQEEEEEDQEKEVMRRVTACRCDDIWERLWLEACSGDTMRQRGVHAWDIASLGGQVWYDWGTPNTTRVISPGWLRDSTHDQGDQLSTIEELIMWPCLDVFSLEDWLCDARRRLRVDSMCNFEDWSWVSGGSSFKTDHCSSIRTRRCFQSVRYSEGRS